MANTGFFLGDKVAVLDTPETRELGVAGVVGRVADIATTTAKDVEVIGALAADFAVKANFADTSRSFWFAPQLLENVSDAEALLLLKDFLTERIEDVVRFGRSVEGKDLRIGYRRLVETMKSGDELWNYHWSLQRPH